MPTGRMPSMGLHGPFRVVTAKARNPLYHAFLASADALGHPAQPDFNGAVQEGLGPYDFNIRDGRRECVATAFLRPVEDRANLEVWTRTHTRRVLFEGRRAVGVEVDRVGARQNVYARREIVLSAGAIDSPQILELCGIGDPARLRRAGIAPVHALPAVGENLQDHLGVYLTYRCNRQSRSTASSGPTGRCARVSRHCSSGADQRQRCLSKWAGSCGHGRISRYPTFTSPSSRASISRLHRGPGPARLPHQLLPAAPGEPRLHACAECRPDRRALDRPELSLRRRRHALHAGWGSARPRHRRNAPPRDLQRGRHLPAEGLRTDNEIDAWVRGSANTIFHPVGTCRMGVDGGSVVDARLKVRGLAGLRVADASVMPTIVGGNTSAPRS